MADLNYHFRQKALGKPRRDRTRAALLDGIVAVAARRGLDRTTVQAVTRESGLAHGTFYNHFDGRDDLIVAAAIAIVDDINEDIIAAVSAYPPGLERMAVAVHHTIRGAASNPNHGSLLAGAMGRYTAVTSRVRPSLRADLRAARRGGEISVRPNRLLDEQIGVLIGLSIRLALADGFNARLVRGTVAAILRLLGLGAADAEARANKSIGRSGP